MKSMTICIGHTVRTPVEALIAAITACNTQQLAQEIQALTLQEPTLGGSSTNNPLDQQLPGSRLTALHVAAKAYSHFRHDRNRAFVYNRAVELLLEGGANPYIEALGNVTTTYSNGKPVRVLDGGVTAMEVCQGHPPPALSAWFAEHVDDNLKQMHAIQEIHSTTLARQAKQRMSNSMEMN